MKNQLRINKSNIAYIYLVDLIKGLDDIWYSNSEYKYLPEMTKKVFFGLITLEHYSEGYYYLGKYANKHSFTGFISVEDINKDNIIIVNDILYTKPSIHIYMNNDPKRPVKKLYFDTLGEAIKYTDLHFPNCEILKK